MSDRYTAYIQVAGEERYYSGMGADGKPKFSDKIDLIFYNEVDAESEIERLNDRFDEPFVLVKFREIFDAAKCPKTAEYVIKRETFTVRCNRCGSPVLKSEVPGYKYQCMSCDEDLTGIETHEGEFHTPEELNTLLLDTRDLLLLDNKEDEE